MALLTHHMASLAEVARNLLSARESKEKSDDLMARLVCAWDKDPDHAEAMIREHAPAVGMSERDVRSLLNTLRFS